MEQHLSHKNIQKPPQNTEINTNFTNEQYNNNKKTVSQKKQDNNNSINQINKALTQTTENGAITESQIDPQFSHIQKQKLYKNSQSLQQSPTNLKINLNNEENISNINSFIERSLQGTTSLFDNSQIELVQNYGAKIKSKRSHFSDISDLYIDRQNQFS
ncbi:hypothetical protein PPERSA_07751 [Pseudocohnilembus persalinus]|uniref:Uncharacterized protein n=1 Tax=Pseudocohnilembus persalinus TaxID=266149 RepID=A0A0V0RAE3_PSEPJ|nr:hypothetical protein PPERSA_07751 [Pseudocohnilembus persalinus]|eukprot:KRX11226.1 hypothetical protein PPERSA_07751 [Pseudocohnilembus persalinus]